MPSVTVVIPLYNKEKYVKRAVDSVLAQTFRDFELIMVNDGSTDNGPAIVREYNDPRMRIIDQENRGVSAARNRGIRESCGELIAFLDADDEWMPGFLDTVVRLEREFPDAGAYATGFRLLQDRKYVFRDLRIEGGQDECGCYFDLLRKGGTVHTSCIAVRRSAFEKTGTFREGYKRGEDLDMWFRIGLHYRYAYSPMIHALYHRYLPDNTCHTVKAPDVSPLYISFSEMTTDARVNPFIKLKATKYLVHGRAMVVRDYFLEGMREIGHQKLREYRKTFGITAPYIRVFLLSMIPSPVLACAASIRQKLVRCMLTLKSVTCKWICAKMSGGNTSDQTTRA